MSEQETVLVADRPQVPTNIVADLPQSSDSDQIPADLQGANIVADLRQGSDRDSAEASQDAEPQTFSADYVKQLRDEAAAHRVKAKRLDEANRRTVAGIAELDGRLINPDEITLTEDMLDEHGIVDKSRVQAAIHALLQEKPYLGKRTPTTTLPQGVRHDVEQPVSLFQLVRERM